MSSYEIEYEKIEQPFNNKEAIKQYELLFKKLMHPCLVLFEILLTGLIFSLLMHMDMDSAKATTSAIIGMGIIISIFFSISWDFWVVFNAVVFFKKDSTKLEKISATIEAQENKITLLNEAQNTIRKSEIILKNSNGNLYFPSLIENKKLLLEAVEYLNDEECHVDYIINMSKLTDKLNDNISEYYNNSSIYLTKKQTAVFDSNTIKSNIINQL